MTTAITLVNQGVVPSLEAARKRLTRSGHQYSQDAQLTPEQIGILTEKKRKPKGTRISEEHPRQQQPETITTDLFAAASPAASKVHNIDALSLINYADMALYAVGLFFLLGASGLILALMIVAFYYETVRKIKQYSRAEQEFGIFILGAISLLGAGLHYVTYCILIAGIESLPMSEQAMSGILAFATSGIAFSALYQKVISSPSANTTSTHQ